MVSLFNHYMKFKGSHLTAFLKHEEFHYVLYMLYINKIREKKELIYQQQDIIQKMQNMSDN